MRAAMGAPSTSDLEIESQRPPRTGRTKVVYVMGAGHSGSTILGVALGNCEGCFYAGELDNWLIRSGTPVLGGAERVEFWDSVREQVTSAEGLFGDQAKHHLERSLARFRVHQWSTRRRLRSHYRQVAKELYEAIAHASQATHVVDSSHFPLRAWELQSLPGVDMYLIFLIRDPQSVVHSFNLHVNRHDTVARLSRTLNTNADLWMTHLLSLLVFMRHPRQRRMLVRHEDFLAAPERVLSEILRRVDSHAELPDLGSLRTGFPLFGNRLIKADVIALKRRVTRPRRSSHLTSVLQLPWLTLFSRMQTVRGVSDEHAPTSS